MHLKKQWIWYCAFVQMLPQLLICIQVCMHNVQTMGKMYLYPHFPVACFLCAASPDPGQGRGLELDTRQYNYRYINIYLMKIKQWWWLETMGLGRIVSCWINMSAFLSLSCSSEVLLCFDEILFLKCSNIFVFVNRIEMVWKDSF